MPSAGEAGSPEGRDRGVRRARVLVALGFAAGFGALLLLTRGGHELLVGCLWIGFGLSLFTLIGDLVLLLRPAAGERRPSRGAGELL